MRLYRSQMLGRGAVRTLDVGSSGVGVASFRISSQRLRTGWVGPGGVTLRIVGQIGWMGQMGRMGQMRRMGLMGLMGLMGFEAGGAGWGDCCGCCDCCDCCDCCCCGVGVMVVFFNGVMFDVAKLGWVWGEMVR